MLHVEMSLCFQTIKRYAAGNVLKRKKNMLCSVPVSAPLQFSSTAPLFHAESPQFHTANKRIVTSTKERCNIPLNVCVCVCVCVRAYWYASVYRNPRIHVHPPRGRATLRAFIKLWCITCIAHSFVIALAGPKTQSWHVI